MATKEQMESALFSKGWAKHPDEIEAMPDGAWWHNKCDELKMNPSELVGLQAAYDLQAGWDAPAPVTKKQ